MEIGGGRGGRGRERERGSLMMGLLLPPYSHRRPPRSGSLQDAHLRDTPQVTERICGTPGQAQMHQFVRGMGHKSVKHLVQVREGTIPDCA